jgi:hypothetical protein
MLEGLMTILAGILNGGGTIATLGVFVAIQHFVNKVIKTITGSLIDRALACLNTECRLL